MRYLFMLAVAFCAVTLAGCNTVEGFGRDLENAGEKIQEKF